MHKLVNNIINKGLCTGCGTCVALCPHDAIKLIIDGGKGIYVPTIIEELCTDCGLCYKICPGYEVDFKSLNLQIFGKESSNSVIGNNLNCFVGYTTDESVRFNSSSGGLITAVLLFALDNKLIDGALVTRMKKDNPLEPEPFIARTKEEIIEASQSKYCPVPANIALDEILKSEKNEKFAVVGLPCHIHGIRKVEQINKKLKDKIVFHFGIVCNHAPTFLATEFLLKKLNIKKEDIKLLSYRGEGWPGGMKIITKKNKVHFISLPSFNYWSGIFGLFFSL